MSMDLTNEATSPLQWHPHLVPQLLLSLALLVSCSAAYSQETFDATADAYTKSVDADVNFGNRDDFRAQKWASIRGFVQFDLSSFSGSSASSAFLEIYVVDADSATDIDVHKVLGSWGETTLTHNNQPSLATPSTSFPVSSSDEGTVLSVDITYVFNQLLADPANDFGIALSTDYSRLIMDARETGAPLRIVATPAGGATNATPVVDAGTDFTVTVNSSDPLNGSVSDDGLPNPPAITTTTWSVVSGPGSVTFTDATDPQTDASFDATGSYVLRLTADDSALQATDDVAVTVIDPPSEQILDTTADTYTKSLDAGANFGGDSKIRIQKWAILTGFYAFDVTSLPQGFTASDAQLKFRVQSVSMAGSITVHKVLGTWDESTLTHNTKPALGPVSATFTISSADIGQNRQIDITALFNELVADPANNFGIAMATTDANFWTDSREQGIATQIVAIPASANVAPSVSAGIDQSIALPDSASLSGSITDDGLPNPPASTTVTWDLVSGPGSVTFGDANNLSTTASFDLAGSYVLRITGDDGEFTASDTLTVTVNGGGTNQSPTANAGADFSVSVNTTTTLIGTVSDDGLPNPPASVTATWSKFSGPGTVTFDNTADPGSGVTFGSTGDYVLQLVADDSSLQGYDTVSVSVSAASAPPPAPPVPGPNVDPGQASSAESDTIGTTAGNFRVDESGAATYSIPIATAAGTAGVAPQISLNYSSSAGNGIAGQGWSIGGLSAISRCRQTFDQDHAVSKMSWTSEDRFCLDGQRLILTGGQNYGAANSTYQTEIDSGARVTAMGSVSGEPDYFEVKRKDGSTSYYGKAPGDANTSAKLDNGANNTLTWGIRKFEDSVGNPIWFDYDTSGGGQRVSEISYAYGTNLGPSTGYGARIVFDYASRSDIQSGYVAGYFFSNDKRLSAIRSYNTISSESLIREYTLRYDEGIVRYDNGANVNYDNISRLTSIQECVTSTCLPKTTFGWRLPESLSLSTSSTSFSMGGNNLNAFAPADINGDGRMDLVWLEGSGTTKTMRYAFSDGSQYVDQTFSSGGLTLSLAGSGITPIDYNLDGRQDIIYYDGVALAWKVVLSEPFGDGGWRLNSSVITTSLSFANYNSGFVSFVDVDSNGTTDALYRGGFQDDTMLVRLLKLDPSETDSSAHRYHFGDEFSPSGTTADTTIGKILSVRPDFNGDGQVDMIVSGQGGLCDVEAGNYNCSTVDSNRRAFVSDGFTGSSPSIVPYYQIPTIVVVDGVTLFHYPQMAKLQTVDINGDGLSDMFYPVGPSSDGTGTKNEYALQVNRGDGTFDYRRVRDGSLLEDEASPQFVDWNMDGYPDLIWKDYTGSGSVKVRYWNEFTQDLSPSETISTSPSNSNIESVSFFDVNGDAAPDMVTINSGGTVGSVTVEIIEQNNETANVAVNRIESITNGLGATTSITYEPLSYSENYDRLEVTSSPGTATFCEYIFNSLFCYDKPVQVADAGAFYAEINGGWGYPTTWQSLGKNSPVIEMSGPLYVVTEVIGDAPMAGTMPGTVNNNATSSLSYHYGEAKIQASGRGFLGFQRLTTIDNQSGVETTTRYRQDWPFIGLPISTEVNSSSGMMLSSSTNEWQIVEWTGSTADTALATGTAALGPLHVVQTQSVDSQYDLLLDGTAQGALLSTISTSTTYDGEANAKNIVVSSSDGAGVVIKSVDTTNIYDEINFELFEGRLIDTMVDTVRDGLVGTESRKSIFSYLTAGVLRGLLQTETIEPASFAIQTTHGYDIFGNRVRSSSSASGVTRCDVDTVAYGSRGRYVDTAFDCLGRKVTNVAARNAFGLPLITDSFIDLNGVDYVSTNISYSVLGREYYRYHSDGSYATKYLTSDLSNCPTVTAYKATTADGTGASSQQCFDVLARSIRTISVGFDGQWDAQDTEYDQFGRVKRKSEPFDLISGASVAPYWTTLNYDLLGRVELTVLPDGSTPSATYPGLTTINTNAAGQTRTELRNVLGEVIAVTDNIGGNTQFSYDRQGNMVLMVDPDGNTTEIIYDLLGRKKESTDPDKGYWTYDYNGFGDLTLQTDAKEQTQTMTYDGLGRILTRIDKRTNDSTEGSSVWTYDSSPYGLGQLDNVQDTISGYMKSALYDTLGRVDEVITNFDAGLYYEKTTYDQYGRLYQVFDAAGDGSYSDQAVVNSYNAYGYLESIGDAVLVNGLPRTVYRSIAAMNARGQVTSENRGIDNTVSSPQPSVHTMYLFNDATGRLLSIDGINKEGFEVQDLDYTWDNLGNLQTRDEMSGTKNLSETFIYDGLNRLTSQTVSGQTSVTVDYDGIGNITEKTDVGLYQYSSSGTRPHAVTSAGGVVYGYDANGNNTSGDGRSIQYTTFDKPDEITKGIHTTSFAYGPNRARYRRVDSGTNGTITTRYIGNVEIIIQANGDQDRKRYIAGVAIETIHFGNDSVEDYRETHYLHKDHLGSLDVITNSSGDIIVQDLSFDAWGQRRDANNWQPLTIIQLSTFDHSLTTRGFTGHEMLDEVGVIHMNGRIYDPKLGRFLQADPFVQDPLNTQSLNRFSYGLNNPLNATDPSGYIVVSLIAAAFLAGSTGVELVAAAALLATAAITDALIAGASLNDALLAGISAAAFAGLGSHFSGSFGWGSVGEVAAFGVLGGITTVIQGGKFGNGFKSAGLGAALGGAISQRSKFGQRLSGTGRAVARVVVGGTLSEVSGGKFANGAAFTAFNVAASSLGDNFPRGGGDKGDADDPKIPIDGMKLFENDSDRDVIMNAINESHQDVIEKAAGYYGNTSVATAIKGEPGGNLFLGETSVNIIGGLEDIGGGHPVVLGKIEGLTAVAVSLPTFGRRSYLDPDSYQGLSADFGGIPVFVFAPYDYTITLIQQGYENRQVK